ncbi:YdeI/OmpD-associated family protein [Peribacillus alkalitolerans]|uniref:YdeI/OmpD-associated family protein n=1 Tax=Peribacillus alkalitolerans TaxID=1550385 RepID=UPI0013D68012|nr:YdeI/OmpD-associated family protein [Peribacillus alkalitolerans]
MNSTKSVSDKLNFSKYPTKLILNIPDDIEDFNEIEYHSSVENDKYSLVFIFIFSLENLTKYLKLVIEEKLVDENGYLYFAYPKKNNPQYKEYIERDAFIQNIEADEEGFVLGSNIKFSRMISLNDVFTVVGLKEVSKKAKNTPSTQKSQCVDDYIENVEDIKLHLAIKEDLLKAYNELTFGYQKDWARYVFSAKRKETQEKRLQEMEMILGEGYKSIDLYRRKKK